MTLKQCLSTAVLVVVYWTFWLVSCVRAVFSLETLKGLARLVGVTEDECKGCFEDLKIPQHLAVLFGRNQSFVDLNVIFDFIYFSSLNGVKRLTFYDDNGILKSMLYNVERGWDSYIKRKEFFKSILFYKGQDGKETYPGQLTVHFLDKRDGKPMMAEVCRELTHSREPVTVARVTSKLATKGVHEVDFLLAVGCANNLDGFPAWSLRVAEIQQMKFWSDRLTESSYRSILASFSCRDRRLGR
ncbi:unnamed protein product [Bursaphelenchus okinawaensis]|uniref:ditrans,polycis-polyprenyl diphosphate synthase [(2E,6E)-farnesyldiphosphate specific] n=1 Tax=Bursaphelenchus okinawaensis TaxID=465554 RepID=A0A811KBS1_9BILA|nr:unnamed protein product [Bursaphelenchus okinawaensis]CAG9097770.1 unnamed protein product [Bursaphelenchus okinawaensis]